MSRIGNKLVQVPAGVKILIADRTVSVEGPKGKLQWEHRPEVSLHYDEPAGTITVRRRDDERGRDPDRPHRGTSSRRGAR